MMHLSHSQSKANTRAQQPRKFNSKSSSRGKNAGAIARSVIETLEMRQLLTVMEPTFRRADPIHPLANPLASQMFTPAMMRKAYGIDTLTFGAITADGAGQTIAIVDAYNAPTIQADLITFDNLYGLPHTTLTVVNQNGGGTLPGNDPSGAGNSWALETSLDVEWAHAMAPAAKILLVLSNSANDADLYAAVDTARNWPGVTAVSMSWGADEASTDSAAEVHFATPAGHAGVTFFASSGDAGRYSDQTPTLVKPGYPASSPRIVSVGGTNLNASTGVGTYISESGWGAGTSSGSSGGSGGGISAVFAKPSYQSSITLSASQRVYPDVAMDADPNTGGAVIDTYDFGNQTPVAIGGTSLSSPLWSGVMALVNQNRALAGLGSYDGPTETLPKLYSIAQSNFNDVTIGNNGYAAGTGYDLVTGRGTPIAGLLVPALADVNIPVIGSFTVSPNTVVVGTSVTLTASNVTESGGTVTSVNFYHETNGVAGLQITGGTPDTFVGSGTQSPATTWTLGSVSTTGFSAGANTFYAIANDSVNATSSATASATLTVFSVPTPVIGGFNVNPNAVIVGSGTLVTLTATNVTEVGGSVTGVGFYRETNGTAGLQVGSDTLVGAGTQSGADWSLSGVATIGFAQGTQTFYALASDTTNSSSATASANLAVNSASTTGAFVAWETTGQSSYGTQGLTASTVMTGVTNSLGLTRGSGLTTLNTAASNAWGANGWATTSALGLSGNKYITFGLTVGASYTASLTTINLNYRRSSTTAPPNGYWEYQIGNSAFTLIGDFVNQFPSSANGGASVTGGLSLSGISALQNLPGGSVVNFRLTPYGGSATTANFYVYGPVAGDDLSVVGTLTANTVTIPTIGGFTVTPNSVVAGANTNVSLSATNVAVTSGTITGVTFYRETNGTAGLQIGSDTTVGAGSQSGSTWTLNGVSTTGLVAGSYGYYAVATDGTNNSLAATTTLTVTAPLVPTIGTFTVSPTSVAAGVNVTLTAGNVTETGGSISNVNFYLESNATPGLQIGSDTLIGAGTQSGTTWTKAAVSTTGLSIGTHDYYAVATDASSTLSAPSTATLTIVAQNPPSIGSFTISPNSVASGASTTLTALNVTEVGGTITGVNFYLESNGTAGLQTTGGTPDTLVGTGTQSGSDWSISASTTGFAPGTFTYYAVATDSFAVSTSPSSAMLTVTPAVTVVPIIAWDTNGQTSYGTQGLAAGTIATGATNSTGLTRGSGVATTGSPAANAWGGTTWNLTSGAAGITGNQFVTFGLTISSGYSGSLSEIDLNYRRSGTGPSNGYWQYQLNGGAWTLIGDFTGQFSSTATGGVAITPISLTGISSLQNLPAGSVVNFRVAPYGGTASTGTWYVSGVQAGNDLVVGGQISAINSTGTIAGKAYEDRNGNGIFDTGEPTMNSVGLYVDLDNSGTLNGSEPTATTSGTGDYSFPGLNVGSYTVRETIPTGYILTSPANNAGAANVTSGGTATVNFGNFPIVFTGTSSADAFYVRGNASNTEIWVNGAPPSAAQYSIATSLLPSLTFNSGDGNDSLVVDHSISDPTPTGGITFNGGNNSDTLDVRGASAVDPFALTASAVTHNSRTTTFGTVEIVSITTGLFNVNANLSGLALTLGGTATKAVFNTTQVISTLTIGADSLAQIAPTGNKVLDVTTLAIAGAPGAPTGTLDISDGGLVVRTVGALASLAQDIAIGQNNFDNNGQVTWDGKGIVSSAARAQNLVVGVDAYVVGAIRNADLDDLNGVGSDYTTWMGANVNGEDVLVRFTYAGDTNLDGTITIDDYNLIDAAFSGLVSVQGWASGDFDFNGSISIDDYNAIDAGFGNQTGPLGV